MNLEEQQKAHTRSMIVALDGIHRQVESGSDTIIHILAQFAAREIASNDELQVQRAMSRLAEFGFETRKIEQGYEWHWQDLSGRGENGVLVMADILAQVLKARQ